MSALSFDVDREIAKSISAQRLVISTRAQDAVHRLYWMYAVGSGICGCGGDMQGHPVWDNHSPTEMPIDKDRSSEVADMCEWCDMTARGNALQPEHDRPRRSCGEKHHGEFFETDADSESEECPHETFESRYIGRGVYRHDCLDCGEITNVDAQEWGE